MKLKEFLNTHMVRPTDIAERLGKSRQAVSFVLNRDIEKLNLSTMRKYCKVVGIDFEMRIRN